MIIAKLLDHGVYFVAQTQKYYRVALSKLKIYYVVVAFSVDTEYLKHEFYLQFWKFGLFSRFIFFI